MAVQLTEQYANAAASTLNGALSSGATTLTVSSATDFPSVGQFRVIVDNERMIVTAVNGAVFTVSRGQDGTSAAAHADGAVVTHCLTAESLAELTTGPVGSEDVTGQGAYLLACHQSPDERPYLMGSPDGKTFDLLAPEKIFDPGVAARDPSIVRFGDLYYVAFTHAADTYFSVWQSPDLTPGSWTLTANVSMAAIASLYLVWAPDWFIDTDGTLHTFVSCSTGLSMTNFQIYEVHPTADDLSTWSAPTLITGTGLRANMIDPHMQRKGDTYYLWYKEDGAKYVEVASSSSLTSGYTIAHSGNWAGWGSPLEAPCLVKVDADTWRIYLNEHSGFNSVAVYYSESTDDWATWSPKVAITSPWVVAHPGIIRVRDMPTLRNMLSLAMVARRPRGTSISRASTQAISSGSTTAVTFTSIAYDDLGAADLGEPCNTANRDNNRMVHDPSACELRGGGRWAAYPERPGQWSKLSSTADGESKWHTV